MARVSSMSPAKARQSPVYVSGGPRLFLFDLMYEIACGAVALRRLDRALLTEDNLCSECTITMQVCYQECSGYLNCIYQ